MIYKCPRLNTTYKVTKCYKSNIPYHYKCVAPFVTDVPVKAYKENMLLAVESLGVSYKYKGSDGSFGFMYTYTDDSSSGTAVAIYNSGSLVGFIAMLSVMFNNYPKNSILVQPHGNNVSLFYSMAEGYSIRNWHIDKTPLVIMVNKNIIKFKDLYIKLGLTV